MKKINFKTYLQKRKQRIALTGVTPRADWFVILVLGATLLLVGIGYAVFLYVQVNNGSLFEIGEENSLEVELQTKKRRIEEKVKMIEEQNRVEEAEQVFDESGVN